MVTPTTERPDWRSSPAIQVSRARASAAVIQIVKAPSASWRLRAIGAPRLAALASTIAPTGRLSAARGAT